MLKKPKKEDGTESAASLTAEEVKDKHPVAYAEILSSGREEGKGDLSTSIEESLERGKKIGMEAGVPVGAKQECERQVKLDALFKPGMGAGCEKIITEAKADGTTQAGDAAIAVLAHQNEARATAYKEYQKDAPKPIKTELEGDGGNTNTDPDPLKTAWETGSLSAGLQKEFGKKGYDSFRAFYEKSDDDVCVHYRETRKVTL